jgi:hypothetical protein
MPIEEILNLLRAQPFVPFRIHLLDGTTCEVQHPEMVFPGHCSVIVAVDIDPHLLVYKRTVIVSLISISRLERLEVVAGKG